MAPFDFLFYLLLLVVAVLGIVFVVLLYSGFFYTIRIRMVPPPVFPHRVAYVPRTGPYKNAGEAFDRLCKLAGSKAKLFGIYYDDPETVPSEKLRYIVGCCLPDTVERRSVSGQLEDRLLKNGYNIFTFPVCNKVILTEFPWRNKLSILLAIFLVYPAIHKYIKEFNVVARPCIEYYESDCIRFMLPLEQHDEYYVPEVTPPQEATQS